MMRAFVYFGFEPPPAKCFAILPIMVVGYLGIVKAAKRVFTHTSRPSRNEPKRFRAWLIAQWIDDEYQKS
jgi:hypothetical protein